MKHDSRVRPPGGALRAPCGAHKANEVLKMEGRGAISLHHRERGSDERSEVELILKQKPGN